MIRQPGVTVRYTMMRIAIFIGCLVVMALLVNLGVLPRGLGRSNFLWILLLAVLVSAPISFVVLRKQRDEMSAKLSNRVEKARLRLEANRSQEDEAIDLAERAAQAERARAASGRTQSAQAQSAQTLSAQTPSAQPLVEDATRARAERADAE